MRSKGFWNFLTPARLRSYIDRAMTTSVRPPAVAGMFYPGDPHALAAELDELLGGVEDFAPRLGFPKALVVPHAGYVYSGAVAAHAYDAIGPARGSGTRVVPLGPGHRLAVPGL